LLDPAQKYFNRQTQLQFTALLLSEAVAQRESETAPNVIAIAGRALPLETRALTAFVSALPGDIPALLGAREWSSADRVARSSVSEAIEAMSSVRESTKPKTKPIVRSDVEIEEQLFEEPANATSSPIIKPEDSDEHPLMVTHAGLILLHPFLARFLESTGVKENTSAQLSPFHLPRAAALLYFIVTGQEEIFEYDLAFVKTLLGLTPEASLCVSEGLVTETDKAEAEGLLTSAIAHWTALKKTSADGFRRSFLQRQGLLRDTENGWQLQVERQPHDVLLEHLPWSISVVKLPWMTRPIYTEW
jgi:hypothetical protein